MSRIFSLILIFLCFFNVAYAEETTEADAHETSPENETAERAEVINEIGMILATMNEALVYKEKGAFEILMGDRIERGDAFGTGEWSRLKMLILDGTSATIDANTRMSIDAYEYSEESGGNTSFTLYEGFVRLISGKTMSSVNTDEAEVTAERAAFEIIAGVEDRVPFTGIACLDGEISIKAKEQRKTIKLGRNQILTIVRGEKSLKPMDMKETGARAMSRQEIADLKEITALRSLEKEIETAVVPDTALPPVNQQPVAITPVSVVISFP